MFDKLANLADDPGRLLDELVTQLVAAGRFHELFDARLLEARRRLGLPIGSSKHLDDLEEPLRTQLEEAYLAACREVGQLLLEGGRFHEAWMYLRPAGEKQLVREALRHAVADEKSVDELIQIALLEKVAVERGFGWTLGNYGTCHAITTLDNLAAGFTPAEQQACAAVLVRHVHDELTSSVKSHIEHQEGTAPREPSLATLVADRPWLFANEGYHVDPSHLAATVRYGRLLEAPDLVRRALDLTEYGRRLDPQLQMPGDPPFVDVYPSHGLFFAATLGQRLEEAERFFAEQAESASLAEDGPAAVEAYLTLLARTGAYDRALEAYLQLVPSDVALSPQAPNPMDLARRSGNWDRYFEMTRQRDDAVGYVLGRLEAQSCRN